MQIGFIGFGNMAQALARGLAGTQAVRPEQIGACARDYDKLRRNTEPDGFRAFRDAAETVRFADVVIVAVKPGQVGPVVGSLREALRHKIVVSVGRRRDVRGLRADAGARYAAPLDRAQYAGRRRRRDRRLRKAAFAFGGGVAVRREAVVARRTGATGRYPAAGRRRDGLRLRSGLRGDVRRGARRCGRYARHSACRRLPHGEPDDRRHRENCNWPLVRIPGR